MYRVLNKFLEADLQNKRSHLLLKLLFFYDQTWFKNVWKRITTRESNRVFEILSLPMISELEEKI